jgi:hypothetical protein
VIFHKLVQAKINIRARCCKKASIDTIGRVTTTRLAKLRDIAGGGKEEREQRHGKCAKDPSKCNKTRFLRMLVEALRQRVGFVKGDEDVDKFTVLGCILPGYAVLFPAIEYASKLTQCGDDIFRLWCFKSTLYVL